MQLEKKTSLPFFLGLALFLSGVAGLVNQVVWQRALKVFLGGGQAICSMVVVLAFMLGLGLGSYCVGMFMHKVDNPLRAMRKVEILLVVVNILVLLFLSLELSNTIFSLQRMAMAAGIPLRLVYVVLALALLLAPCFLMGLTMPLAAEACERQLAMQKRNFIEILFVVNTIGALSGAMLSGFILLPYLGQSKALFFAILGNGLAATLLTFVKTSKECVERDDEISASLFSSPLRPEEIMGFGLGFCSLAYEVYVMRLFSLAHEPLPVIFSVVVFYFLAFWSFGLWLASRLPLRIGPTIIAATLLTAAIPSLFTYDRWTANFQLFGGCALYFLPCFCYGILFGQLVTSMKGHWGKDVGRYFGINTFGSCLGISTMTLIGFHLHYGYLAWLLALVLLLLTFFHWRDKVPRPLFLLTLLLLLALLREADLQPAKLERIIAYSGADGVIELDNKGNLAWDGLWHSHLSDGKNHVSKSNWLLAAIPVLCHETQKFEDLLVIGLGTGITTATLAKLPNIKRLDTYDINATLKLILEDFPLGTLNVGTNKKVNLIWQDGRSGLELSPQKYDLITQQPLYLKQAGSAVLLSREYFQLVQKRLKKNGVFCIYARSETAKQASLVRATAASVFPYCESFGKSYMIIASNEPFTFSREKLDRLRENGRGPFWDEVRRIKKGLLAHHIDKPRLDWKSCPYVISDDHPLVEHPHAIERLVPMPASKNLK